MSKIDYAKIKYTVNGRDDFDLSTALRLWKTKYIKDFKDFERAVITNEALHDFREFVREIWNEINPVSISDAFSQKNTEVRRTYFDAIGPENMFKSLDATLLDRQVIKKKRTRWDDKNDLYEYEFEDVYELYKIDGSVLFKDFLTSPGIATDAVYAVRCWCTTTNREYWLYVPGNAVNYYNPNFPPNLRMMGHSTKDAIAAIAWTIRIDIINPERIYRQGDIIIVKMGENSKRGYHLRHLEKDEYLQLMYSET